MRNNDKTQRTESAPAMPEEWRAQMQAMNDKIAELKDTLSQEAAAGKTCLEQFDLRLQKNSTAVLADTNNTLQKMQVLFDSYMTLQGALDKKDAEIKRLKDGYDTAIFRRFLRRFIRVDEAARDFMQDASLSEAALKGFRQISNLFEDALAECGVEKFSPKIGEDYRKAFGVADRPEEESTDITEKDYEIAAVLAEGYALKLAGGELEAVAKARVKIFKYQKEN